MVKKYVLLAAAAIIAFNPADVKAEGKNGIAAIVNGEKITVENIREAFNANPQIKNQVSFEEFYAKAVDILVNSKVLLQAAEGEKITSTPEYKKQLDLVKDEIARKVYLEKKIGSKINDAAIKKLYGEYKSNFKSEKEIKAKHILVDTEAKAKEVIAKLKKGEGFNALAKQYSKEPAELGYFTKTMMVPEFGEAAFALKKGTYTETPVKTQFGYHVIMVEDIRDSKPLPMEQIEPQLRAMLTQQQIAEVFGNLLKNAKIEKYGLDGKPLPVEPVAQQPAK